MLFGGETQDVNVNADAGAVDSSDTGSEIEGAVKEGDAQPSADSLNADDGSNLPEHVPYSRFKEINDAKKALEEKIGKYGPYEQMDEILAQHPELQAEVETVFRAFAEKSGQKPQEQNAPNDELSFLKNEVQSMKFEKIRDLYKSKWGELTKDVKSEDEMGLLMKLTEIGMYAEHNAPYAEYNEKLLLDSFKKAKELTDKVIAGRTAGYVKDKIDDDVPGTGSGAGALGRKHTPQTREERAAFIAQGLKAGRKE